MPAESNLFEFNVTIELLEERNYKTPEKDSTKILKNN